MTSLHSLAAGAAAPPPDESPEPIPAASTEPVAEESTTLTRIDDSDSAVEGTGARTQPDGESDLAAAEPTSSTATDWWTVASGDHLWHIAEETLVDQGTTAPTAGEVGAYWRTLCEANHDRLLDPGNPDLIMPGQRIVLPPVPAD